MSGAATRTVDAPGASSPRPEREGLRWPTPRTWFDVAVLTVLAAVGVIGFEPSFGGYGFLLAGMGGLLVGTATGVLTSAFRFGPILTAAAALVGYFLFGDVPTGTMLTGTAIVVSAGIFVIFREHQLELKRRAELRHQTPQG